MIEFKLNKFLENYFTTMALLPIGPYREMTFMALADIFRIARAGQLYRLCENERVRDIDSEARFFMYSKLKKISAVEADDEIDDIITAKGQVLVKLQALKLKTPDVLTGAEQITHLAECSRDGIVPAMVVYGFVCCEGICVRKDLKVGLSCLRRAAFWHSVEACLMCLKYDPDNTAEYLDLLLTASASCENFIDEFAQGTGHTPEIHRSSALLSNAFSQGITKREKVDHTVYRILSSEGLSYADKKSILMSGAEFAANVAVLPINVRKPVFPRVEIALPFERKNEVAAIEAALATAKFVSNLRYRPLLICGEEKYLLEEYAKAIAAAYKDCNVQVLDVADVDIRQFDSGKPNIVISNIIEKKPNVVIFALCGSIDSEQLKTVAKFLDTADRSVYKVASNVTLNLAHVLPIVICDPKNAEKIKNLCNIIDVTKLTKEEKAIAIKERLQNFAAEFDTEEYEIDDDTLEKLTAFPIEETLSALDRLAMALDNNVITFDAVKGYLKNNTKPALGFRGE